LILFCTVTAFSYEPIRVGSVALQDGYFFSHAETAKLVKELARLEYMEKLNTSLQKQVDLSAVDIGLLEDQVELEKSNAALAESKAETNLRLYKDTDKERRKEHRKRVLTTIGAGLISAFAIVH